MGIVDKINHLMNPDAAEEYDDGDYMFDEAGDTGYGQDYQQTQQGYPQQNTRPGAAMGGAGLELKVVKPERFEDGTTIADHLLANRTVVLNLEDTNAEVARRLIDFLTGVTYSIDGNLKKVADHTFVITPNNVALSAERMSAQRQQQQRTDTFGGF